MKKLYASLFLSIPLIFSKASAQCPVIVGAFVNSCNEAPNTEGLNEFVAFRTTAQAPISNYVFSYGSNNPPTAPNTPSGVLSGAALRTKDGTGVITSIGGCTVTYVSDPSTVIPALAPVAFIPSNFTNSFDISALCTSGTVYIALVDTANSANNWNPNGTLANNPNSGSSRYLEIDNGATICNTPLTVRSYNAGWPTNDDGNVVIWDAVGTAIYANAGCDLATLPEILPLKLSAFNVVGDGTNAKLSWQTVSETNTLSFEIQRSTDGFNFETIYTETAAGNSNDLRGYNYIDKNIPSGANYYRLKMMDADGKSTYTKVIKILSSSDRFILTNLYPKPAISEITLTFNAPNAGTTRASIYDFVGRLLSSRNIATNAGMNNIQLPVGSLQRGEYVLKLEKDGQTAISKFTKQ